MITEIDRARLCFYWSGNSIFSLTWIHLFSLILNCCFFLELALDLNLALIPIFLRKLLSLTSRLKMLWTPGFLFVFYFSRLKLWFKFALNLISHLVVWIETWSLIFILIFQVWDFDCFYFVFCFDFFVLLWISLPGFDFILNCFRLVSQIFLISVLRSSNWEFENKLVIFLFCMLIEFKSKEILSLPLVLPESCYANTCSVT